MEKRKKIERERVRREKREGGNKGWRERAVVEMVVVILVVPVHI
jgi:hypothetical protein